MGISLQDVMFAAILALFITWFIRGIASLASLAVNRSTVMGYRPSEVDAIIQRCHNMFPIEFLRFNGALFSRGMQVRVVTMRKATIEAEFIGVNGDNMVCLLTPNSVIAHELDSIEEIRVLDKP